jgi:hypothetical protein
MARVSPYGLVEDDSDVSIFGQAGSSSLPGGAQIFRTSDEGDGSLSLDSPQDIIDSDPSLRRNFDISRNLRPYEGRDTASAQSELNRRLEEIEQLRIASEVDGAALQGQYEGIISRFRDSWQLTETQEEKDRLLYMLADIEAQYDAGQKSIDQVYSAKIASVRKQAEESAAGNVARTEANVGRLTAHADALDERLGGVASNVGQSTRGMGVNLGGTGTNEYANLVRAQIPIHESSLFNVGQIGVDAMNYLAEAGGLQQAAQQGDLSRLRAATTSAGQYGHMRDVSQRIERERTAKREFEMSTALRGVAAAAAAASENRANTIKFAEMGDRAADRALRTYDQQDNLASGMGMEMRSFEDFLTGFTQRYDTVPSTEQINRFIETGHRQSYNAWQQQVQAYNQTVGLNLTFAVSDEAAQMRERISDLARRHAEFQHLMNQIER